MREKVCLSLSYHYGCCKLPHCGMNKSLFLRVSLTHYCLKLDRCYKQGHKSKSQCLYVNKILCGLQIDNADSSDMHMLRSINT